MKKRFFPLLALVLTAAAVLFCVLNEIYAALLLSPEQARPQLEALTEILAQFAGDPLDQNALLRLYDLRAALQN